MSWPYLMTRRVIPAGDISVCQTIKPDGPDAGRFAFRNADDSLGIRKRGVPCWGAQGNEADDLAATLAVKVASAGHQATIVSTDKGYCQLLSPTIRIRDYFQKRWLDAPFIASEFGVSPEQLPDYWGLAGSAALRCRALPVLGLKAPHSC